MKSPVVYPVSADLSALLGAAVDADAAWVEPQPAGWAALTVPAIPIDPKAEATVSEIMRRMNERLRTARLPIPRGQR